MGLITQRNVTLIEGHSNLRPSADGIQPGTLFLATDTEKFFVLQRENGVSSWVTLNPDFPTFTVTTSLPYHTSGDGTVSNPVIFALPTNVEYWVDPATGNDNNDGSSGSPLQTLGEALKRLGPGWLGKARIHLQAGTYALGTSPKLFIPAPPGGLNAEPILIDGLSSTDSGLGTRTVGAGSTQGSVPTFGTLVDSVGGLTANAFVGSFIRFLTGVRANQSYLIMSNTATTFTVVGSFSSGAPANGDTYVIETPAANITWVGTLVLEGHASALGQYNLNFGTAGGIDLHDLTLYQNRIRYPSVTAFQLFERAAVTGLFSFTNLYASGSLSQIINTVGSYWGAGGIFLQAASRFVPGNSLFSGCTIQPSPGAVMDLAVCGFRATSWVRLSDGVVGRIFQCNFNAVTGAPAGGSIFFPDAFGAAVIACANSTLNLFDTVIASTPSTNAPGDAILVADGAVATIGNVSGSGNAGVGLRVRTQSMVRAAVHNSQNTVTGVNDVIVGASAATTWAAIYGTPITIDAAEQCLVRSS